MPSAEAEVERDVLSVDITERLEPFTERVEHRGFSGRSHLEDADAPDLLRLLRLRNGRNDGETENDREPDPPHGHLGGAGCRESNRALGVRAPASKPVGKVG